MADLTECEHKVLKTISEHTQFSFEEAKICYLNFECRFENVVRHFHYAAAFGLEQTEPISITKEWAIKFGLEKDLNSIYRLKRVSDKVHLLQNIYYDLYLEELTIK